MPPATVPELDGIDIEPEPKLLEVPSVAALPGSVPFGFCTGSHADNPAKATASRFFASSVGGSPVAFVMQRLSARGFTIVAVTGAVLVAVSFTLVGHTSTSGRRGILAQLLLAHLLIVAFWFGALWPLCQITLRESR